jgi:hypothetical protein
MEIRQIVDKSFGFLCRELIIMLLSVRIHVAVTAFEIAGSRHVPRHNRAVSL